MAFGLFKKKLAADLILKNGRIITQNAEMPQAEAVACKDNKIIAVGSIDSMDSLINDHTQVVDMEGRYAVPGFISLWDKPALEVFCGEYLDLSVCDSRESLLSAISSWQDIKPERETVFGFGYSESLFDDSLLNDSSAISAFLDSACSQKPVVLLCENNISCIYNSCAAEIISQTAEEEMVRYITTPYILNLFVPFDFDEIEQRVLSHIKENKERGITSVLSLGAPDYFETFYQDSLISLYNEELLDQRFFSSYMLNRPLLPKGLIHRLMQMKTKCNEMEGLVNAEMLYTELDSDGCSIDFSQDSLNLILEEVSDKNFNIYLSAETKADLEKSYLAAEHIRSKGYKNMITVQSPCSLAEEIKKELIWHESVLAVSPKDTEASWQYASSVIGRAEVLGSIEAGKLADIAVYEDDPYKNTLKGLPSEKAYMTVFNGKIVYKTGG